MNLRIDRSSKNLKIILSIVFSVVLLTGATLIWKSLGVLRQKAKMPVEMNNDETAGWKVYKNDKYAFEIKYPPFLKMITKGPNAAQQQIERGETISGTIQPSNDTVVFTDEEGKEQLKIEIFGFYEKEISQENYVEGDLYLFGACDSRWGFNPTAINVKRINDNKVLVVKGEMSSAETPTFRNCYYLKNDANLIVFNTADFDNQSYFQEIDKMLFSFRFLE